MIIISGNAGSGKTTQGRLLAAKLGCPFFSMGELLRKYGSPQIQAKMADGELLSNAETLPILETFFAGFNGSRTELVTDGFPRSTDQAKWIIDEINSGRLKFTALVHLRLPESKSESRLLSRGRSDDTEDAILTRFREQEPKLEEVLKLFKEHGLKVAEVDAEGTVEEVAARIDRAISGH